MSYQRIADGIYRDSRTGHYYERPFINGTRTWRKLDSHRLTDAKVELGRKRADQRAAKHRLAADPYVPQDAITIRRIAERYQEAGCPDRHSAIRIDGKPF